MNKEFEFEVYRESFVDNLIVLTGISRSGKTLLLPIIGSFDRVEGMGLNYLLEQIPMIHDVNLMRTDVAVNLMRLTVDFMAYDVNIGRNTNFRYSDLTSIWKSKDPTEHLKRLTVKEGDAVIANIISSNNLYLLMMHRALAHAELYFRSYPNLKFVQIIRHPVDLVYSWMQKGYGQDFMSKPRNNDLVLKSGDNIFPCFVRGWHEEYRNMCEADRVIYHTNKVEEKEQGSLKKLSPQQRKQIKFIRFDDAVTKTEEMIEDLCAFLNTKPTPFTQLVCRRERCPRVISAEERNIKFEKIKEASSAKGWQQLLKMIDKYEAREEAGLIQQESAEI